MYASMYVVFIIVHHSPHYLLADLETQLTFCNCMSSKLIDTGKGFKTAAEYCQLIVHECK